MRSKVKAKIADSVKRIPSGSVFSAKDMALHGSRAAVDQALYRMASDGKIRKVARGLYDKPKYSDYLKTTLSPDTDQVAHAIARKFNWKIKATGSATLNQLGISDQVPGRHVYLSNGPTKRYKIGNSTIEFRHATPKDNDFSSRAAAPLVQAIKALGKRPLTKKERTGLKILASNVKRDTLLKSTKSATGWVHDRIKELDRVN